MDIDRVIEELMDIADCDEFSAAEAVHTYCTLNHEGQWSKLYALLSQSQFNPGPLWREIDVEEYLLDLVPAAISAAENEEEEVS